MYKPKLQDNWSESWKLSYQYDLLEVFGESNHLAYCYAYQNRANALKSAVQNFLPPGSNILDVAAGSGNFSLQLAEKGYKMVWNDLRDDLIDYVKLKYEKGDISYLPGNALDIAHGSFDGVIISEIIEHVAHPDRFLKSIANLVRPGGFIFLSTPLGNYLLNRLPKFSSFKNPQIFERKQFKPNADGHIFLLYIAELKKLGSEAGVYAVKHSLQNNMLSAGHFKFNLLLPLLPANWVSFLESQSRRLPEFIGKKIHSNIVMVYRK